MAFEIIQCPSCAQKLRVPMDFASIRVTCPKCKAKWEHSSHSDMVDLSRLNNDLQAFAMDGRATSVKRLLKAGADPNARNEGGNSALMLAAGNPDIRTVKLLVEAGGALEQYGSDGFTPLIIAAFSGHYEVVKYLVGLGANRSHRCSQGKTACQWASENGHARIAQLLEEA